MSPLVLPVIWPLWAHVALLFAFAAFMWAAALILTKK